MLRLNTASARSRCCFSLGVHDVLPEVGAAIRGVDPRASGDEPPTMTAGAIAATTSPTAHQCRPIARPFHVTAAWASQTTAWYPLLADYGPPPRAFLGRPEIPASVIKPGGTLRGFDSRRLHFFGIAQTGWVTTR